MDGVRGYFGIGIVGSKTAVNVGTLWRSAATMDAAFIFTAGRRFPQQASDTIKSWRHVPMLEYTDSGQLFESIPFGCVPVAVELAAGARDLTGYVHPERAVYLLGAEDNGLPRAALERCRDVVRIPSLFCLNVAVAGSIVMYDRAAKQATHEGRWPLAA